VDTEFQLIFGIQQHPQLPEIHYPEAFVANLQKGVPAYFEKLGIDEVLSSYNLMPETGPLLELIEICKAIHPSVFEEKYSKNKKKLSPLSSILEDKILKSTIQRRLDDQLSRFIKIAKEENLNFYYHVERKIFLPEIKLSFSDEVFRPFLKFDKTALGINYHLSLKKNDKEIIPFHNVMVPITMKPAHIILDHMIYAIEDVDGLKLKPFLKKENVFIPDRLAFQYFKDFVADMLTKAEVSVTGMDYETVLDNPKVIIQLADKWMGAGYDAILSFHYDGAKFIFGDKATERTLVNVNEQNQLTVKRIKRHPEAEQEVLLFFKKLGLSVTPSYRLDGGTGSNDPFDVLMILSKNLSKLEEAGMTIYFPKIDGRDINHGQIVIDIHSTLDRDWFDLRARILVGKEEIPFAKLLANIRLNDRIYHLKNGGVFIIPLEWMEKYATLAKFASYEEDKVQVYKSNFAVLETLDLIPKSGSNTQEFVSHVDELDYQVSPLLLADLRPYQLEGAKWLVKHHLNGLGACLADDMGLGKTVQTLAVLLYAKETLKANHSQNEGIPKQLSLFEEYVETRKALCSLIVLPASLVFNWESEIKKFAPSLMVKRHVGKERSKDFKALIHFDLILTTYQTLLKDVALFSKINFHYIVLDESHYIKNRDSKIFNQLTQLKTDNRISLSGTPIENSLADLWSQMQFINPDILGDYDFFKKHFQDPIQKNRDESAISELRQLVAPFILRRTKSEVLKDLPDLDEQILYSEMDEEQAKWFEREKSKARNQLLVEAQETDGNVNKIMVLNTLMRLRQLANHPLLLESDSKISSGKFADVTNTIESVVKAGHKILVFSGFVKHLEIYETYLKKEGLSYSKLTGEDSQTERKNAVEKFNEDPDCKVFLMSIKAGGVGLNLTSASYVLILDPWWNPFVERQAVARAHRLGQQNKVTVIRFIAKDSIEEKILKLQIEKLHIAEQFVDVGDIPTLDKADLTYLLD